MEEPVKAYVGFFDIMGFKDFVYRNSFSVVAEQMALVESIISDFNYVLHSGVPKVESADGELLSQRTQFEKAPVESILFSDSIVIVCANTSAASHGAHISACASFAQRMLKAGIPVKGALAAGDLGWNPDKSICFGQPLIDAYELGEAAKFYGAALHHSYQKLPFSRAESETLAVQRTKNIERLLRLSQVPFRGGTARHAYLDLTVNAYAMEDSKPIEREDIESFYDSSSGIVRQYVDASLDLYFPES